MKKVITYGTFDLLHYGHINLLKKAKEKGDYLIVGLSSDEFNFKKGKSSYHSYEVRKSMLESIKDVDMVIVESSWDQKITDVINYGISAFVIGEDWLGEFDFLKEYCDVVYLKRTPEISSSLIKEQIID